MSITTTTSNSILKLSFTQNRKNRQHQHHNQYHIQQLDQHHNQHHIQQLDQQEPVEDSRPTNKGQLHWDSTVIDNEFLNRKKSCCCCCRPDPAQRQLGLDAIRFFQPKD